MGELLGRGGNAGEGIAAFPECWLYHGPVDGPGAAGRGCIAVLVITRDDGDGVGITDESVRRRRRETLEPAVGLDVELGQEHPFGGVAAERDAGRGPRI